MTISVIKFFLGCFGTWVFLRSQLYKFSKLLVQPPHLLVHIIKANSHSFEQIVSALVHSHK